MNEGVSALAHQCFGPTGGMYLFSGALQPFAVFLVDLFREYPPVFLTLVRCWLIVSVHSAEPAVAKPAHSVWLVECAFRWRWQTGIRLLAEGPIERLGGHAAC